MNFRIIASIEVAKGLIIISLFLFQTNGRKDNYNFLHTNNFRPKNSLFYRKNYIISFVICFST
jgi:hypothetical protein